MRGLATEGALFTAPLSSELAVPSQFCLLASLAPAVLEMKRTFGGDAGGSANREKFVFVKHTPKFLESLIAQKRTL